MVEYEFNAARAVVLEHRKKPAEAARLYFEEGQVLKAIGLLVEDADVSHGSASLALEFGLSFLWSHYRIGQAFGVQGDTLGVQVMEQLDLLPRQSIDTESAADVRAKS